MKMIKLKLYKMMNDVLKQIIAYAYDTLSIKAAILSKVAKCILFTSSVCIPYQSARN